MLGKLFGKKTAKSDADATGLPAPPSAPAPRAFDAHAPAEDEVVIDNDTGSASITVKLYDAGSTTCFSTFATGRRAQQTVHAGKSFRFRPRITNGPGEFDAAVWIEGDINGTPMSGSGLAVAGNRYRIRVRPPSCSDPASKVIDIPRALVLECTERRPRETSDLLAGDLPGLSFGFSASGWLLSYQFGAASCLQDHGIARSSTARAAGASGGSITAVLMMTGCDLRSSVFDCVLDASRRVHGRARHGGASGDKKEAVKLRARLVDAMTKVFTDDSWRARPLVEGRVEVAISEKRGESALPVPRRASQFGSTKELALAVLASSSMGISGMPIRLEGATQDGRDVFIADGGVTDFVPSIDALTITVKPMSDAGLIEGRATIQPSTTVLPAWGVVPPPEHIIEHLFELGYRDMKRWLQDEKGYEGAQGWWGSHREALASRAQTESKDAAVAAGTVTGFTRTVDPGAARPSSEVIGAAAVRERGVEGQAWLPELKECVNVTLAEERAEMEVMVQASQESLRRKGQEVDADMKKAANEVNKFWTQDVWAMMANDHPELMNRAAAGLDSAQAAVDDAAKKATKFFNKLF
jgi:hypothetical protein